MTVRTQKILVIAVVILVFSAWWFFDLGSYLQLDTLQQDVDGLREWCGNNPLLAGLIFFVVYITVTGLSLPGSAVMTLASGALFGFWYALLLVSFASSLGATLAFLVSRLLLRDWVQQRFSRYLGALNAGFAKDGPFYLFSLRLVPLFPFFVINLLMGLLPIRTLAFLLGVAAGHAASDGVVRKRWDTIR